MEIYNILVCGHNYCILVAPKQQEGNIYTIGKLCLTMVINFTSDREGVVYMHGIVRFLIGTNLVNVSSI